MKMKIASMQETGFLVIWREVVSEKTGHWAMCTIPTSTYVLSLCSIREVKYVPERASFIKEKERGNFHKKSLLQQPRAAHPEEQHHSVYPRSYPAPRKREICSARQTRSAERSGAVIFSLSISF